MKTVDLIRFIADNGLPSEIVNFEHEYPNEAYCIRRTSLTNWEVYYSERGQKSGLLNFESESKACEYLKNVLATGYNNI